MCGSLLIKQLVNVQAVKRYLKSQRELALFVLIYKIMEYYLLRQNRPHWIILLNDILKKLSNEVCFALTRQTSLDNFVKRHSQKIQLEKTQKVVEWIVLDLQPFKVVEGEAFREMVSKLDPQYQVPSRETIKKAIMKSFKDRKTVVKNFIKNITGKIALTTDI